MKNGISLIVLLTMIIATNVHATIIYKADTNPTGIPDLTQENVKGVPANLDNAICFSAAAGNALWYFDHLEIKGVRKYKGLVKHTKPDDSKNNWGPDGYTLVKELTDEIYVKNGGSTGILRYIYSRRGEKDVSLETKTYKRGKREVKSPVLVYDWNIDDHSGNKITNDLIKNTVDNKTQVGILTSTWHEKGEPANEFMKSGTQLISHHLTVAGRDDQNKQLVVAHGWGDHWTEAGSKTRPVFNEYYDEYDYKIEDNHMRITDAALINRAGGLAGRIPDYAEIESASVVDSQAKQKYGVKYFRKLFPKPKNISAMETTPEDLTHFEFFLFNDGPEHLRRMALQIPVLDIENFLASDAFNLVLPDDWTYRLWDPNIDVAGHHLGTDQGITNWYGFDFVGLLFETSVDFISPGTGLNVAFDIDSTLLDWSGLQYLSALNTASWSADNETVNVGLAIVPVPEPTSLFLMFGGFLGFISVSRLRHRHKLKTTVKLSGDQY